MEENLRLEIINNILSEYCSDEYKNRHSIVVEELNSGELPVEYDDEFDKVFIEIENNHMCTKRRYFV